MTLDTLNRAAWNFFQLAGQPFARSLSRYSDFTSGQRTNEYAIELSRHDHHNLEVKANAQSVGSGFESALEIFLFVPSSFQLGRWNKSELMNDFRSRLRLAVPVHADQGNSAVENAKRVLANAVLGSELGNDDAIIDASKELGAVLSETLKQLGAAHNRQFLLAHSLTCKTQDCRNQLARLCHAVRGAQSLVVRLREVWNNPSPHHPILELLDEYASHLYVQYLSGLRSAFAQMAQPGEKFATEDCEAARTELESLLGAMQKQEAQYRHRFEHRLEHSQTPLDQEHRLIRLSQLKKFFQSKMFFDVTRQQSKRKVSESTAAVGAACAGLWAAFFQTLTPDYAANIATKGMFFACFGVVGYVLKDRIKDWAKAKLNAKASEWLPDAAQALVAEGKPIGTIKEWFRIRKQKSLPREVLNLRHRVCASEAEKGLPEDVFHFRKSQMVQELNAKPLATGGDTYALQENIRINVERYLKHMDDPFKELAILDSSGHFTQFRSHRVYHFHLCVRAVFRPVSSDGLRLRPREPLTVADDTKSQWYRIVMDKKGIDRVEELQIV